MGTGPLYCYSFCFGDHQKLAAGKRPHSALKATPASTLESPSSKCPTPPTPNRSVSFEANPHGDDSQPAAQLSIADTINNGYQFEVQDLFDDEQQQQ